MSDVSMHVWDVECSLKQWFEWGILEIKCTPCKDWRGNSQETFINFVLILQNQNFHVFPFFFFYGNSLFLYKWWELEENKFCLGVPNFKLKYALSLVGVVPIDIHRRSQTYTALCIGIVSHGAQIGGLRVFADHTRKNKHKTNAPTIFAPAVRHFTHVY